MFHFPKNIFSPRCISSSHQSINLGPAGGAWEGIAWDAPLHHNYHHIYRRCITFIIIFILSGLSSSLSSLSRDTLGYNVTHLRQECVTIIKPVHLIKFMNTGARSRFNSISGMIQHARKHFVGSLADMYLLQTFMQNAHQFSNCIGSTQLSCPDLSRVHFTVGFHGKVSEKPSKDTSS